MKKKWIVLVSLIIGLTWIASSAHAVSLESIRQAIQQKGAAWNAGDNAVWQKSDLEKKALVGTILEGKSVSSPNPSKHLQALPAYFDWRDAGVVTSIKNQGQCGGCWAFASVAELESLALILGETPALDLSEQFLISYNLSNHGCNGGTLSRAADFLEKLGTPSEACKPYRETSAKRPKPCDTWKDELQSIGSWVAVAKTVEDLKAAVFQQPVATGFYVFSDFYAYVGGVYTYVTGKLEGGHAVLIVGWDDANQCFIVKNSWGTGWGEDGYFRIAYSEMDTDVQFGLDSILYDPNVVVSLSESARP